MGREIRNVPRYAERDAPKPQMVGTYRPSVRRHAPPAPRTGPRFGRRPYNHRPDRLAGGDHFQLYENISEGTPISPVFPDLEFLVHHIITQGDDLGNKWPPNAVNLIIKDRYIPTSVALAYRV